MQYQTTAAYVSGGICGNLWMPSTLAGKPFRVNLRGPFGIMDRFTEPVSFREALLGYLTREGGDFQGAEFTADTVIRIERRCVTGPGKYSVHVREREVSALRDCADLVNAEAFTGDFFDYD